MRKLTLAAMALGTALWGSFLCSPAYADRIPAPAAVPQSLPIDTLVALEQRRQALQAVLKNFLADAAAFNAKDADHQDDAEYGALLKRRSDYIAAASAFNKDVSQAIALRDAPRSPSQGSAGASPNPPGGDSSGDKQQGYGIPGLPGIYTGGAGSGSGLKPKDGAAPQPKADDSAKADHAGVPGLPGLAINDGQQAYGIPGLPGIYTGGAGPGSGLKEPAVPVKDKTGGDNAATPAPAATPAATAAANSGAAPAPPLVVTPQTAAQPIAALQQQAAASKAAAAASTPEEASAKAQGGFDQALGPSAPQPVTHTNSGPPAAQTASPQALAPPAPSSSSAPPAVPAAYSPRPTPPSPQTPASPAAARPPSVLEPDEKLELKDAVNSGEPAAIAQSSTTAKNQNQDDNFSSGVRLPSGQLLKPAPAATPAQPSNYVPQFKSWDEVVKYDSWEKQIPPMPTGPVMMQGPSSGFDHSTISPPPAFKETEVQILGFEIPVRVPASYHGTPIQPHGLENESPMESMPAPPLEEVQLPPGV